MKKQLLWVLTLALLALFPYQNATANLVELSRSGWTATASSQEEEGEDHKGYASNAKDGNNASFWHTRYNPSVAQPPHWIMFDLGSEQTFDAFNYVSRGASAREGNGAFNEYILYTSNSAPNTSNIEGSMTRTTAGTFSYGSSAEHTITLNTPVTARYVMLYAVSTWGNATNGSQDNQFGHCVEFKLYKNDYCTNFANSTSTHTSGNRSLISINFSDNYNSNTKIDVNQTNLSGAKIYFDKTSNVITLAKGTDITPDINWNGWAMHAYLYVDWDKDKDFTPNLGTNGVPAEDSEIIAYSYYNGRNHKGTSVGESTDAAYPKAMPSFIIPESIPNGEYRARYMILWSKMDPCAICNTDHHPAVVDFTIRVVDATPTNSRKQNLFSSANISQANRIYPYRIPGITSTNKEGRLIATAARLVCGTDPGYGQVDAVCKISDDNGITWSEEKVIAVGTGRTSATENYFDTAYGDPAVVADRTSDEVIVVVVAGCTVYTNGNTTRSNPNMIGIIRSTNNGDTWGEPVNITEDIYSLYDSGNPMQSAFVGGGKIFQSRIVKVGQYYRLYAALCARPTGNRVIYSDNFGRTWHALGGASAVLTPDNGNEPKCEELPDGRVILSSRNANGNGRLYNIYTYTNTTTAEGSWGSCTASTFEGSNQAPGGNNTNGEILLVPVKRNSDNKEMYLALQSQPTGNDRVNVGIYYKELTNLDDINTVANFATGWNGFYQVSSTYSAYSSMDLQDDGKVGFIYEETLTRDGTVQNPVSTSFPTGAGTHNFDGYNNIYVAYTIEQLTGNAYSLKEDVNRGTFVKTYLTAVVDATTLPATTKDALKADITAMGDEPTTDQVDAIYTELNRDPWDGQIVTFTNIQSNGDQRVLYINNSVLSLGTTSQTAESIGTSAQFLCTKQANGKYSFKNIATNEYMIWRATDGVDYSYNSNKGTLSSYEATYCDWTLTDTHSTKANTYCMVSKRSNGTDDGSLCVAQSNGAFDSFGNQPICGKHTNNNYYSNVYYINIVSSNIEQTIATAKEIINKTGVGYPKATSTVRTTLQNAISAAEANSNSTSGIALQNAINAYYASTDIEIPVAGNLYSFIVGHATNRAYIYNNNGTLAIASYTEGTTVLPETAKFTCEVEGDYFHFRTSDGKYVAFPSYGKDNYTDASPDGIEDAKSDKTKFSIAKLYNNINVDVTTSNESLFGKTYLTILLRGHKAQGGVAESGVYVVKFKDPSNGNVLNPPVWDGAGKPYDNGNFSSAISVISQKIDERTITVQVSSSDIEKGEVAIEGTTKKTVTTSDIVTIKATANEGYKFVKWTVDDVEVGTNATYNDATSGNKTYTAHFTQLSAEDKYADICKPGINSAGNTTFVNAATISEGVNIEDATIALGDLAVQGQKGVTAKISAKSGATFNLNLTYSLNWGDLAIFGMTQENSEMLYGPFEGSWVQNGSVRAVLTPITEAGLTVNETTVTYPITIPSTLQTGDIYVVRALTGVSPANACDTGIAEGGYLDFLFEIEGEAVPHTIKVVVAPSEGGSVTINGEERSQIEASGIATLLATPKEGYRFLNWTNNEGTLISEVSKLVKPIVADTTYRANFVKVWSVTATSNNDQWGTVTIDGKNSEGSVDHATTITLTAVPTTGGKFIHWTLNEEPLSTQNPFKTTILKDEVYKAVFEKDYPAVKLKFTGNETQMNRYLKSMTAVAGDLTTIVFDADSEISLPRVDAEYTAYGSTATPTTTGALIDKTANTIKVMQGTTTLGLTFKQWTTEMINGVTVNSEPQLKYTQQTIFVDWNGDKDFADTDETYDKSSNDAINDTFAATEGYTRNITIPNTIQPGVYRMRVVYHESVNAYTSDWREDFKEATSANIVINGKVYDFAIEIVADENYITFTASGGTYYEMGEIVDVTLSYPVEGSKIYYTTNGFDPDENSAVIDNGGSVALNTFNEGVATIKARAYNPESGLFTSPIYSAVYNISSHYSLGEVPTTTYNANTTTIVGAAISNGVGVENGTINHNFVQGQRTATASVSVAGNATFNLDVTFNLKWYGFKLFRINYTDTEIQRSIVKDYIGSNANEVNATKFESDLTAAGYTFTKDGDQYRVSIPVSIKTGENELPKGSNVAYRFIVTSFSNLIAPSQPYGDGEYVDFMFTVQPTSSVTKLAGTSTKDLNVTVTTTDACYLQVGGYSQNLPEAQTLTIPASLNTAGEMDIQVVGAEIEKMDIEVLELGTNILLPNVDYLGEVTLKSAADFSATTLSHASVLPEEGIKIVVEKEIYVPYTIDGKMPTYFNFLSMPFDFDPGVNIEFYNPNSGNWEPAILEKDIRILTYKSNIRANGQAYYNQTWNTIGGTGGLIYANQGFVLVGNSDYGDADHKMKVRFTSFYAEQAQPGQLAVTRELSYKQDGNAKTITAIRYRNQRGETHPLDADWQHVGSPYLTHSDGIDYVLYYHDGYKYKAVEQTENPKISAFQSVMFQANLGGQFEQNILITPLSIGAKTKAANGVYGRANLAINDDECVKIVLKDDASENFVVNEDAWYMAPTTDLFSTMSVNVEGGEASISVQPEPNELPLTVYAGAKSQQTISLSRYDGEVNIFLKDAATNEVVCLNDEEYTFTATPYSTIAGRFTVSMIEPTGITESVADATIKAVVTGNTIKLYGTEEGDQVSLYTANGMMITNAVAQDGVTTIPTTATGVIIIKVAEETIKVVK